MFLFLVTRSFFPNQFIFHTLAMGTPGCLLCSLNMDPVEAPPPHQIRCDGCSQTMPSYDIVHYGSMEQGFRQLCSRCFNTEVAHLAGLRGSKMPSSKR